MRTLSSAARVRNGGPEEPTAHSSRETRTVQLRNVRPIHKAVFVYNPKMSVHAMTTNQQGARLSPNGRRACAYKFASGLSQIAHGTVLKQQQSNKVAQQNTPRSIKKQDILSKSRAFTASNCFLPGVWRREDEEPTKHTLAYWCLRGPHNGLPTRSLRPTPKTLRCSKWFYSRDSCKP